MSDTEQTPPAAPEAPDLREKGTRDSERIALDRRLFLKFTACGRCQDVAAAADALERNGVTGALYLDANDPRGIGIVAVSEDPDYFVTGFRDLLNSSPFDRMEHKGELDMLGRTYTIGYESDLEHVLFERPISRIADRALRWAIWYPLRRAKGFAALPPDDQRRILAEHGTLGHRYGSAGLALDVRLACHGLDRNDNDFIIGLLGAELFPLSSIVQAMRGTEQTSRYLESLGPFFVGRAVWQGKESARLSMTGERLFDDGANRYDALLVVSFGGPEGMEDVMPFLDNVLAGLRLPEAARRAVARRYERFGGVSPINAHTRALVAALEDALERDGPPLRVYCGNRNWHPLLPDTLRKMEADGVERAVAFVTSTFGSYNGCRKYREDLHAAARGLERPPRIDKLRYGYNHPGFIAAVIERVADALAEIPAARRGDAVLLFTAHSLPEAAARRAPYVEQLGEACALVAEGLGRPRSGWRLAFQSRNARYGPGDWLGPDVRDALAEEKASGATDVVVAPIGFVCDHMELALDLDIEARERADELGLGMVRAATVGTHPEFVGMVLDLVRERMAADPPRAALGTRAPSHDLCPSDCCPSGRPGPAKPGIGGHPLPLG